MKREALPQRRQSITFEFRVDGGLLYQATVGYYPDGRPGEIFLDSSKSGTDVQVNMRDAAIAISFALQYGAHIEDICSAFTRRADGSPEGPLGVLLDMIVKEGVLHVGDSSELAQAEGEDEGPAPSPN